MRGKPWGGRGCQQNHGVTGLGGPVEEKALEWEKNTWFAGLAFVGVPKPGALVIFLLVNSFLWFCMRQR